MAGRYGKIKCTSKAMVNDKLTIVLTGINNGKYVIINGKKRYLSQVSNWHNDLWKNAPSVIKSMHPEIV